MHTKLVLTQAERLRLECLRLAVGSESYGSAVDRANDMMLFIRPELRATNDKSTKPGRTPPGQRRK